MKKIDLGQVITVLANIGVIAGIAFLAYEIRLTRNALVGATYQQRTASVENWDFNIANSDNVARAIMNYAEASASGEGFESLSEEDKFRLGGLAVATFNRLDNFFYQYELGLISEEMYQHSFAAEMAVQVPRFIEAGTLENPYVRRALRPSFQREIEKYLDAELVIF